jgi:hypothetical protein
MFVEVAQAVDGRYAGRLVNEPVSLSAPACGDLVDFGPDNVIELVRFNRLRRLTLKRQMPRREQSVFTKSYVCFHVFNAVSGPRAVACAVVPKVGLLPRTSVQGLAVSSEFESFRPCCIVTTGCHAGPARSCTRQRSPARAASCALVPRAYVETGRP